METEEQLHIRAAKEIIGEARISGATDSGAQSAIKRAERIIEGARTGQERTALEKALGYESGESTKQVKRFYASRGVSSPTQPENLGKRVVLGFRTWFRRLTNNSLP